MIRPLSLLAALGLALSLGACGHDHDHDHDHEHGLEELAEDACAHVGEGTVPVAASADPADAATAVSTTHQAYRITLQEVEGQYVGAVLFTAAKAGDHAFFTDTDVPFAILDGTTPVEIEETEAVDACPGDLSTVHVADLARREYRLVFGPTSAEAVTLITLHTDDAHGH